VLDAAIFFDGSFPLPLLLKNIESPSPAAAWVSGGLDKHTMHMLAMATFMSGMQCTSSLTHDGYTALATPGNQRRCRKIMNQHCTIPWGCLNVLLLLLLRYVIQEPIAAPLNLVFRTTDVVAVETPVVADLALSVGLSLAPGIAVGAKAIGAAHKEKHAASCIGGDRKPKIRNQKNNACTTLQKNYEQ
jgi:hypothetical protein